MKFKMRGEVEGGRGEVEGGRGADSKSSAVLARALLQNNKGNSGRF